MTKDITKKDFISVLSRKTLKPRYLFISFGFWKSKKHQQMKLVDVIKANGWDLSCFGLWRGCLLEKATGKDIHKDQMYEVYSQQWVSWIIERGGVQNGCFPKTFLEFFFKDFSGLIFYMLLREIVPFSCIYFSLLRKSLFLLAA